MKLPSFIEYAYTNFWSNAGMLFLNRLIRKLRDRPGVRVVAIIATALCIVGVFTLRSRFVSQASETAVLAPIITTTNVDSIITSVDGDGRADPGDTLQYTVTIANGGVTSPIDDAMAVLFTSTIAANETLVPGSLTVTPIAGNDAYTATGNIPATPATGVLANDVDPLTGVAATGITVTKVQGVGANVGAATATTAVGRGGITGFVTLAATGTFTYEPPPGFIGNDTFTYNSSKGGAESGTATVTITVSNMAWFIDNTAMGSLNRGTFSNPFTTIATFNTANAGAAPNPQDLHHVVLRGATYNEADGINLRVGQTLTGGGTPFNTVLTTCNNCSSTYTTFAASTPGASTINATAGNAIDLNSNHAIRGLGVGNTPGFFGFNGGAIGNLTVANVTKTGTGGAINITTSGAFGTNVTFASISSSSSPGANLNLVGVTGTLGIGAAGTGLTGSAAASNAINILGGGVVMTFAGNVTKATTGALLSVSGGHNGTLTFNTGTLSATSGIGLQFDNADGNYTFSGTNTLGGGDAGLDVLNGSSGTWNFSAASTITSPTGTAFNVGSSPGNPIINWNGTVTQNTTGQRVVNVDGTTGGAVNITTVTAGSVAGGAGNTGVNINNAAGSVSFTTLNLGTSGTRMTAQAVTIAGGTGAYSLGTASIFTNTATGLAATNADGTINCTSATVIDATNARALIIDGPAGLTTLGMILTKVASTSSASTGMTLQDTNGSFSVIGDNSTTTQGGNGTGGTISNVTGADGSTADDGASTGIGIGVYLNNASGVQLRRMTVTNTSNFGVEVENTAGLTMQYCRLNGTHGSNTGQGEGAARFLQMTGTVTIDNNEFTGSIANNVRLDNNSGTLTDFIVSNNSIHDNNNLVGNDGIGIDLEGTATVDTHITNNALSNHLGDHIDITTTNTASVDAVIKTNTTTGTRPAAPASPGDLGRGIRIFSSAFNSPALIRYDISNNIMTGTVQGGAIHVTAGGPGTGTFTGQITNNVIGATGVNGSGASQSDGIIVEQNGSGAHNVAITNNMIRQYFQVGINTNVTTPGTNGTMDVTLTGNTVTEHATTASTQPGVFLNSGNTSGPPPSANAVCYDLRNNTLSGGGTNSGIGSEDFRVRQRFSTTVRLPGATAGNLASTAAIVAFLQGQNTGAETGSATTQAPGSFVGGAACNTPSVPTLGPLSLVDQEVNPPSNSDGNLGFLHQSYGLPSELLGTIQPLTSSTFKIQSSMDQEETASIVRAGLEGELTEINDEEIAESDQDEPSVVLGLLTKLGEMISPTVYAQDKRSGKDERVPEAGELLCVDGDPDVDVGTCAGPGFTLPAQKGVTITYRVTLNSVPFGNGAYTTVSNQGTVSGSNFAAILTDGPGGTSTNPTVTNVDHTTVAVASNVNPAVFGQAVTFTATMTGVPSRASDPPGTVQFKDNGIAIGAAVPIVVGTAGDNVSTAVVTTSALTFGNHVISAEYSGGGSGALSYNLNTGSLAGNPQTINSANTTTTITDDTPDPTNVGIPFDVDFTVAANAPGTGVPTGSVTVSDGVDSCNAALTAGAGTCSITLTTAGARTLTAMYTFGQCELHSE